MNNRERQWYEGKYGRHPPTCNCYACREAKQRKVEEEEKLVQEQAKMREGAEQRIENIKKRYKPEDL